MTAPISTVPVKAAGGTPQEKLHQAARQLEGVFYAQLFQAMRNAVPSGADSQASSGEEMFTGMLDGQIAELAAGQGERGLASAMYRQLSGYLSPEAAPSAGPLKGEQSGSTR